MADSFEDFGGKPIDSPGGSVKFTGKMPAAVKEELKKLKSGGDVVKEEPHISQARLTGSAAVESLINSLTDKQYDEIELPSLGVFYDGKDGPKDGKLHIREMTGAEEQILATSRWVKKGQAIDMIFSRCLQEQYKTENLLSADRTFLLIFLRGISYTPQYEVELKCPACSNKFPETIDLTTLHVNKCPKDFHGPLLDKLPKSGFKFSYRLSRGRDETAIQQYREDKIKKFGEQGADDTLLYRTAVLLEEVENVSDKLELVMLLKKLPIQDVSYMRNLITEPPFGVETKIEIGCPMCLNGFEIDMPLEANFFFPRQRKKDKILA